MKEGKVITCILTRKGQEPEDNTTDIICVRH